MNKEMETEADPEKVGEKCCVYKRQIKCMVTDNSGTI